MPVVGKPVRTRLDAVFFTVLHTQVDRGTAVKPLAALVEAVRAGRRLDAFPIKRERCHIERGAKAFAVQTVFLVGLAFVKLKKIGTVAEVMRFLLYAERNAAKRSPVPVGDGDRHVSLFTDLDVPLNQAVERCDRFIKSPQNVASIAHKCSLFRRFFVRFHLTTGIFLCQGLFPKSIEKQEKRSGFSDTRRSRSHIYGAMRTSVSSAKISVGI